MAFSKGAKKFCGVLLVAGVLGGLGYKFFSTPPKSIMEDYKAPAVTEQAKPQEIPAAPTAAPAKEEAPAPVKHEKKEVVHAKKPQPKAKHVETHTVKPHAEHKSKPAPTEEEVNHKALNALANGTL